MTRPARLAWLFALTALVPASSFAQEDIATLKKQAIHLIQQDRTSELLTLIEKARALYPKDSDFVRWKAEAHFTRQEFDLAIKTFEEAQVLDPAVEQKTFNFGLALMKQNRLDDAKARFETLAASGLDASFKARGHFGVGLVLAEQGDEVGARGRFEAAVNIDPTLHRARYRLGVAQVRTGETEKGIVNLKSVIEKDPLHFGAAYNLAQAYRTIKNKDLAEEWQRRFKEIRELNNTIDSCKIKLQANPRDFETLVAMARALAQGGNLREAVGTYAHALETVPGQALVRLELARVLVRANDLQNARRQYEAVVGVKDAPAEARAELADLYERIGEAGRAKALRESAPESRD